MTIGSEDPSGQRSEVRAYLLSGDGVASATWQHSPRESRPSVRTEWGDSDRYRRGLTCVAAPSGARRRLALCRGHADGSINPAPEVIVGRDRRGGDIDHPPYRLAGEVQRPGS